MSTRVGDGVRDLAISPEILNELRPHIVNLSRGRLSSTGLATTTPEDVEQIFTTHLPAFIESRGGEVPVVFWAHGGLVDERSGLLIAHKQVRWWKANGVYPISFVWEAGLGDALRQLFFSAAGSRDLIDDISDKAVEWAGRHLGGAKIWGAMKSSAELAVASDGGARLVAEHLGEFLREHPGSVRLHAVGHSAGSIFHRYFLPVAIEKQASFASLSLLAPAIRVDEFLTVLDPLIGRDIAELALFTMDREHESADTCSAGSVVFYHHSLLMLIRAALEGRRDTPILGLQESIQADPALWSLFGPGRPREVAVVWSPTPAEAPARESSTSISHGGFDDDQPTMDSLARRITGRSDIESFPVDRATRPPDVVSGPHGTVVVGAVPTPDLADVGTESASLRALCVGINAYPAPHALTGCVSDALAWKGALTTRGFEVDLLLDGSATRRAIVERLATMIASSSAGDVLVFQYSGHGTSVTSLDGDEPFDQALCPVDFARGALLVDDDIAELVDRLPEGVSLTVFLDCCHSATATRDLYFSLDQTAPSSTEKPRFVPADPQVESAHRRFRLRTGRAPVSPLVSGRGVMREVTFSACLQTELAYENAGQGDFSRFAVPLLASKGLTNRQFQDRVVAAFGPAARQHPYLDAAPDAEGRELLAPLGADDGDSVDAVVGRDSASSPRPNAVAAVLRGLADVLDPGTG